MARSSNARGGSAAGAKEHVEADAIVAQGPATYRCPSCDETFPEDELVAVRECSRDSCGLTFAAIDGRNCPECNSPFTRLQHELGCPSCGDEGECEEDDEGAGVEDHVREVEVLPANPRADFAVRIRERWQESVTAILDVGRLLTEAKTALPGEFEAMVEQDLPFGPRTAQMLMAVAAHPVLMEANHGSLPPSWRTLYELTRLPEPVLVKALGDGTITSEMERKDVAKLHATTTKTTTDTDTVVVAVEYAAAADQELEPLAAELDVMEKALAAPDLTLNEVANIARRALVIQNRAAALTILAERRAGELLSNLELVTTADATVRPKVAS